MGRWFLLGSHPTIFFAEWDGRKLWIGTDRADRHKLTNTGLSGCFHQLSTVHEVIVEKLPWLFAINADPADRRSQMNDHILILNNRLAILPSAQIVCRSTRDHQMLAANSACEQSLHDMRAKKTRSASHDNPLIVPLPLHRIDTPIVLPSSTV